MVWRRWAGLRPTGIDRICLAWIQHYAQRSQAVIIHRHGRAILPVRASQALFRLLAAPESEALARAGFRMRLVALALRHGFGLAAGLTGRGRLWLNPGHTGLDAPGLADWCQNVGVRPLYLVHDLIPITHPQFCRAGEAARHRRRMRTMLETGHALVANSSDTLEQVSAFAAREGLRVPPAVVAWPGTFRLPHAAVHTPAVPTFVVLGTIEGRKNHQLLLGIWERMWRVMGADAPRLVIIGRRGWQAQAVFSQLEARGFGDRVLEAGALDDDGIARHVSGARALLFPSHAEGYGLPLAEALAAGVPSIASDLGVFREIGQGVPDLLPLEDPGAWQEAILDYARPDSTRRAAQMARMRGFRAPAWDDHFAKVDMVLEGAAC